MMTVHRNRRMEALVGDLCDVLRRPASRDPFAPEWVVVHGGGMERWVSMHVAQTLGVAANLRFLFPAEMVRAAMAAALQEEPAAAWDADRLAWVLLDVLPGLLERDEFAPLAAFLGGTGGRVFVSRREVALALRLAEMYDRYLVFRRDVVAGWDRGGEPSDWQARLWRALRARVGPPDPAEQMDRFLRTMAAEAPPLEGLPPRLCVFGTSALPPTYLQVLEALGRHREVHLFAFAPSPEWFGDARTPGEAARARRLSGAADADLGTRVHPLLAAFGRLSRDFQAALVECEERGALVLDEEGGPEGPGEGPPGSMLTWLQRDIWNATAPEERHVIHPSDPSIRVHSCHGPMRQVEVLRDALLALFEADPTLSPRDVLVMTPDIEAYAPLVEAVFGDGGSEAGFPQIPFQIADRSLARESPAAAVVRRVFGLARGRLPASEVLDLLAEPPVVRRFGMTPDDLARAREMVRESGIRWGLDADHRAELGLPRTDENTWRFGLDRLLLGYAMSSDGGRLWADVLPCDLAAGGGGGTLPRFVAFLETLFDCVRRARDPRSLLEWVAFTEEILDRMVGQDEEGADQAIEVRQCARGILKSAQGFSRPLDLDAWAAVWEGASSRRSSARAFFRGGVTFAALVPLRNLPFRVIALMGLDDEAFPRQGSRFSFDLLARDRRPGDRSTRDEDLQLFLEALLSARERLIITFTGVGVHDNQPLPPAVPVAQLLDVLDASFHVEGASRASEFVLVRHPLQPFSPRVFSRPDVPAYDRRYEAAARALLTAERVEPRPRFDRAIAPRDDVAVSPEDLGGFLGHPTKALLKRLGFWPQPEDVSVADREPVVLVGLDRHEVGEEIVASLLFRNEPRDALKRLQRAGRLPLGSLAAIEFALIEEMARPLVERARDLVTGPAGEVAVDLEVEGTRIVGPIQGLFEGGLVSVTFSKTIQARLLRLWVCHLVGTVAILAYPGRAWLVSRSDREPVVTLGPLVEGRGQERGRAKRLLADLVRIYRLGCTRPLPLFAKTSHAFAERIASGDGVEKALQVARTQWNQEEREDPFVRFAFGDVASPEEIRVEGAPSFEELAVTVFEPLLSASGGDPSR